MKWTKLLIVLLVSGFCMAGPIGSPVSTLDDGQSSVAVDYMAQKQDVQIYGSGMFDGLIPELRTDLISVTGSRGVGGLDVFARIGWADVEQNDGDRVIGAGARATLIDWGDLKIGMTGQFNIMRLQTATTVEIGKCWWKRTVNVNADLDITETTLAIGPSYEMGNLTVYGGPAVYRLDGDIETNSRLVEDGSIKETTSVIGYVGGKLNLVDGIQITGEYQFASDFQAVGVGAIIPF